MDLSATRRSAVSGRPIQRGRFLPLGWLVALALVLAGLSAFYHRSSDPALFTAVGKARAELYILSNGFHTDLVLPRQAIMAHQGPLALAVAELPGGDWVQLGWGDADYYTQEGPLSERWADGVRALLGRGQGSVVRMETGRHPEQRFQSQHIQHLNLSHQGMKALLDRVSSSLTMDDRGKPILTPSSASDGGIYWQSHERFWIGHLCNHWTQEALAAAGLKVWPWRPMTSGEVMRTARLAQTSTLTLDLQAQAH